MTTIFTDDFSYVDTDISLCDAELCHKGRDLVFSTRARDSREFRVSLSDQQLSDMVDMLCLQGYGCGLCGR